MIHVDLIGPWRDDGTRILGVHYKHQHVTYTSKLKQRKEDERVMCGCEQWVAIDELVHGRLGLECPTCAVMSEVYRAAYGNQEITIE